MLNPSTEMIQAAVRLLNRHSGPIARACNRLHDRRECPFIARKLKTAILRRDDPYLRMRGALGLAKNLEIWMKAQTPEHDAVCAFLDAGNQYRQEFHEPWDDLTPFHPRNQATPQ